MEAFLDSIKSFINEAGESLRIEKNILNQLQIPNRILQFSIPLKRHSNKIEAYPAFRIQHSNVLGPYKGGIRFFSDLTLESAKALALIMTFNSSLVGLPLGGSSGGICVNLHKLSQDELEDLSRGYVKAIYNFIGPNTDILAPDLNVNSQIISWMVDEYSKLEGKFVPASFTGKPINIEGSKGRTIAVAYGGAVILGKIIKDYFPKMFRRSPTIVIQGFGSIGSNLARILKRAGFRIVGISDSKNAIQTIHFKDDFNPDEIYSCIKNGGTISDCYCVKSNCIHAQGLQLISNAELLEKDVDILILAATEKQINKKNADKINAKIILEMANGPITSEADIILEEKEILVIPDILANAGGVIANYLEWFQNIEGSYWPESEVLMRVEKILLETYREVKKISEERVVNLRKASYIKALKRIAREVNLKNVK